MNKLKIKESYLILLIVVSLVSLGIYTTYALFTASTTINDVVGITATLDIGKSMSEYEVVTVPAGETKLIELNVVNSYNGNIYYGAWYQIVKGNSDNIQIGLYTERNSNPGSGSLSSSSNINLLVGITNDNSTSVTLYIGVKGSLTNELNLGTNKILIPDGFSEALLVTEDVLKENATTPTENTVKTYSCTKAVQSDTLSAGIYILETWGAQGGSYSTTYTGGKGGYSTGTLTLKESQNIYVYVGCQGSAHNTTTGGVSAGGFNGGGSAKTVSYSSTTSYVTGGGGASDIRIGQDSLYARVIVAGGGSGSSNGNSGYYGGGTSAGYGVSGYGGTATSAGTNGSFGVGASANPRSTNYKYASPGGGGGWYGGGSSGTKYSDSTDYRTYTGGGSGYVYTSSTASNYPSGNKLNSNYYLTDTKIYDGNTTFENKDGKLEKGHSGDGFVRISQIIIYSIPNLTFPGDLVVKYGQNVNLTSDTTLTCEYNTTTGCSIIGTSITDTSTLSEGTHILTYTVKGKDNKKYLFNRNILVEKGPILTGSLGKQILIDNPTISTRTDFSKMYTTDTTGTIFKQSSSLTSQMTEDINGDGIGEDVYYYSGNPSNNWVKFGNYYWRIIRINEDGSVRLILTGTEYSATVDTNSVYITSLGGYAFIASEANYVDNPGTCPGNHSMNAGYMYGIPGSLANNRKNTNSSNIKTTVDNWYKDKILSSYDKYVSKTAIYCADRSVGSGTYTDNDDAFNYGSFTRLSTNKNPTYKCGGNGTGGLFESKQAVEDKFSVSTASGGNGDLTYPIALINADELVYAGAIYGTDSLGGPYPWYSIANPTVGTYSNGKTYVPDGNRIAGIWLTMSPSSWVGDTGGCYASIITVNNYNTAGGNQQVGGIHSGAAASSRHSVRPVLSIKACAKYTRGDGSVMDPYIVTVDSSCANAEN